MNSELHHKFFSTLYRDGIAFQKGLDRISFRELYDHCQPLSYEDGLYDKMVVLSQESSALDTIFAMLKAWSQGRCFWPQNPYLQMQPSISDRPSGDLILTTTGTTGQAKAIVHSLARLLKAAESQNQFYKIEATDRWLLSLPLYHAGGIMIPIRTLLAGATCVLAEDTKNIKREILENDVSVLSLVPTQFSDLLAEDASEVIACLRRMKAIVLGGANCPSVLWQKAVDLELPLSLSYGMTETCGLVAASDVGSPVSIYPLKTLSHVDLKTDSNGLVFIIEKNDHDSIPIATNDIAEWDESQTRFRVVGRRDDHFKSGGELIDPQAILAQLEWNPACTLVIFPLDDSRLQKVPALYIWSHEEPELQDLLAQIHSRLSAFFRPRKIFWNRPTIGWFKATPGQACRELEAGQAKLIWSWPLLAGRSRENLQAGV